MAPRSLIPGDDVPRRKITPQDRVDAIIHQQRRRQELEQAAREGDLNRSVHGDQPAGWAIDIARQYAEKMGRPIGPDDRERLLKMASRIENAYSNDVTDLLYESPQILRTRAQSAGNAFNHSDDDEATSAYLYGTD